MNHGISGYNSGGVNPYRQIETRNDAPPAADGHRPTVRSSDPSSGQVDMGPNLSEAEAGMIGNKFPDSERMRLRLYGPGRDTSSVDPGARGRRLDVRG